MIDIIDTLDGFSALKPIWEKLEQNPKLRIFQTYTWCRAAWDEYLSKKNNNRLWILKWHQDGKDDIVIFPFYIDCRGCLRFILDTHSDACDSVYSEGVVNRYWTYKEAADAIRAHSEIKSVFFQKLPSGSEALDYFPILLLGSVTSRDNAFSWVLSPQSESFISGQVQLRRKDRDRLKAIARKASGLRFDILSIGNRSAFPEDAIKRLRSRMVGWRRSNDTFLSDEMISFINKIYQDGKCEIPVLSDDLGVHVLAFRLLEGTRINYWVVEYDNPRLVTELYLKYMDAKVKEHGYFFDFGVGAYGYKLGTYRPVLGVTFSIRYSRSIVRQLCGLLATNIRLLKDIIKPRRKK